MVQILKINQNSDVVGSAASALCLIHCIATPFLFAAHASHVHGHHEHPFWWGLLDLLFIGISFVAVYWSTKHTAKNWMRYALWVSWALLCFVILNEKMGLIHIVEEAIYLPSLALVGLHIYNKKYCNCEEEGCCDNTTV